MISDAELAAALAREAGCLLVEVRRDRAAGVGSADERSDALLAKVLAEHRPGDAILSEELASTGDRLAAERVWIIDPLDGTREYGEPGRTDWAVHVALWNSGDLTAGAVAIPDRDEVWGTRDEVGPPVGRPIRRIAVSRTRPPAWALRVAEELGAQIVPMGSAGAKVAAVLRGDVDAYLHDGGQYEWDSAAPTVVARHYGYFAARADGGSLGYNKPNPYLPDLVVCPPAAAEDLLTHIRRHRVEEPLTGPLVGGTAT
ncbi:MAG: 3'(2'),5'-bisphosphate nucleotidase CysQ [Pseudonocardiales bacterium]